MVMGNFNLTNTHELNQIMMKRGQHPVFGTDTQSVLEEIGNQRVIIWTAFKEEIEILRHTLGSLKYGIKIGLVGVKQLGLPEAFGSCHTAVVDGYVVEGHVPAREISRMLKERPRAVGLAVPGMPVGSPGMDGPEYGTRRDKFAVLLATILA
jgi:hypothetical protein